jgi:hypothetical protein
MSKITYLMAGTLLNYLNGRCLTTSSFTDLLAVFAAHSEDSPPIQPDFRTDPCMSGIYTSMLINSKFGSRTEMPFGYIYDYIQLCSSNE